ncbi:hypothetical protein MTP99_005072 [Tenebrio molitor]|jgi:hypothetical protein|nr:hypothetical protein MTP99_005072 [Tenebrio molitor]
MTFQKRKEDTKRKGDKRRNRGGEGGESDKGNKNREGGVEIHKPREKEKEISKRGNNNIRMGRVLHETAGREKSKRKGKNRDEEEADGAKENRNHSRRGGETNRETKKEKGIGEGPKE